MENGATAEMGLTGNDGVLGIALFMGCGTAGSWKILRASAIELSETNSSIGDSNNKRTILIGFQQ
jgi:hypothetical protein